MERAGVTSLWGAFSGTRGRQGNGGFMVDDCHNWLVRESLI